MLSLVKLILLSAEHKWNIHQIPCSSLTKKKKMSFTKEIFPEMEEDRRWREKQLDYV